MERLSYLLRNGFDPTDCDNADNFYHPSDPLGPGHSVFGHQHQCTPSPRRPIPTDPFEAFRFFNRLQGLKEQECSERAAFEYMSRPRPSHVVKAQKQIYFNKMHQQRVQQRKQKVEKPDIIESFEGDEISNLYFYHPFCKILEKNKLVSWLLGFEIVPGKPPAGAIELPPSSLSSELVIVSDLRKTENVPKVSGPKFIRTIKGFGCRPKFPLPIQKEDLIDIDTESVNPLPSDVISPKVSDVKNSFRHDIVKLRFSSDTHRVARVSFGRPKELSTIRVLLMSMKGFIRLGVSLVKWKMRVVSQLHAIMDHTLFVTEFALIIPRRSD